MPSIVQSAVGSIISATESDIAFGSNVVQGNTIVIHIAYTTNNFPPHFTVTDNQGNEYDIRPAWNNFSYFVPGTAVAVATAKNSGPLTVAVVGTPDGGDTVNYVIAIGKEVSGTWVIDDFGLNTGTWFSGTFDIYAPITTTVTGAFLLAAAWVGPGATTLSAPVGFTMIGTSATGESQFPNVWDAYITAGAAGSYSSPWSVSSGTTFEFAVGLVALRPYCKPTYVQHSVGGSFNTTTPPTVDFGSSLAGENQAGNALVLFIEYYSFNSSPYTANITDSQGNSWNRIYQAPWSPDGESGMEVWIALNIAGGANTITVTPSPNDGNNALAIVALEYRGLQSSPIDQSTGNSLDIQATGAATQTAGPVTAYDGNLFSDTWDWTQGTNYLYETSCIIVTLKGSAGSLSLAGFGTTGVQNDPTMVTVSTGSGWTRRSALGDSGVAGGARMLVDEYKCVSPATAPIISLPVQPGFFDIDDSVLSCNMEFADYDLLKIKYNADLAVVRPEFFFMGYYSNGDDIPIPVSPADGYFYDLHEMFYILQLASSQKPLGGYNPGQGTVPAFTTTSEPVDGFLCTPYQLRPDYGTLTSQGVSTASQLKLFLEFYEHGNVSQNIAQQSYGAGVAGIYAVGQRGAAPLSPVIPGASLHTTSQPVFYDLPDSVIYDGAPITDQMLQAISRNAKLGVFRFEVIFMGYYRDGNTVPLPVGAGGYPYSRSECIFIPILASSRQPTGDLTPGQILFPPLANLDIYSYPGTAFPQQLSINSNTGHITCTMEGANGVQSQGTVAVICLAQRYPGLTMATPPYWTFISDADLVGGQIPTADLLIHLNNNAKFGIVCKEAKFMGYFEDGNTVPALVSPADGYTYKFYETLYIPIWASSKPASGLTPGQLTFPTLGSNHGSGTITASPYQIFLNQYKTPLGELRVTMWQGGVQTQGVAAVYAIGTRKQNPTGTTLG